MLPKCDDKFTREDTEEAGDPIAVSPPLADDVAGTVTLEDTEEVGEIIR